MGCIQSYFKKASARSAQSSPEEQDKKFPETNSREAAEVVRKTDGKTAPIVSEETSPIDEDDESLAPPVVEPTAVRTLAASTGTVAILGTTAKCNDDATGETKSEFDNNDRKEIPNSKIPCPATFEKPNVQNQSITTTAIIENQPQIGRTITTHDVQIIDKTQTPTTFVGTGISDVSTSSTKQQYAYATEVKSEGKVTKTIGQVSIEKKQTMVYSHEVNKETLTYSHEMKKEPTIHVGNVTKGPFTKSEDVQKPLINEECVKIKKETTPGTVLPILENKQKVEKQIPIQLEGQPSKQILTKMEPVVRNNEVEKETAAQSEELKSKILEEPELESLKKHTLKQDEMKKEELKTKTTQLEETTNLPVINFEGIVEPVTKLEEITDPVMKINKTKEMPKQSEETETKIMHSTESNKHTEIKLEEFTKPVVQQDEIKKEIASKIQSQGPLSQIVQSEEPNNQISESKQVVPLDESKINLENKYDKPVIVDEKMAKSSENVSPKQVVFESEEQMVQKPIIKMDKLEVVVVEKTIPKIKETAAADQDESWNMVVTNESEKLKLGIETQKSEDVVESDRASDSERDSTSNDIISVISETREIKSELLDEQDKPQDGEFTGRKEHKISRTSSTDGEGSKLPTLAKKAEGITKFENVSFDETLYPKEVQSPSLVEGREISSTSLNTLGEDDSEISDLEADTPKKVERSCLRRFDTISSNGETSYNVSVVEEGNLSSLSEELSEQLELLELEHLAKEKFQMDENIAVVNEGKPDGIRINTDYTLPSLVETVKREVDKICEQAVEKTAYLMQRDTLTVKDFEDVNNISECSALSALDSVIAEKGSDYDSFSLLDDQTESRPLSVVSGDTTQQNDNYDPMDMRFLDAPIPSSNIPEGLTSADTEKIAVNSVSDDLPKPPNVDLSFPCEGTDELDITEEELKAVQMPFEEQESISQGSNSLDDDAVSKAAVKIQAGVRGYLTRKQLRSQIDETNEKRVYNEAKGYHKNKRMSLDSKLRDIECIKKLPKLRSTLSECVEDEAENINKIKDLDEAAKKIQSTFRGYRVRKSICVAEGAEKLCEINGNSFSEQQEDEFLKTNNTNDHTNLNPILMKENADLGRVAEVSVNESEIKAIDKTKQANGSVINKLSLENKAIDAKNNESENDLTSKTLLVIESKSLEASDNKGTELDEPRKSTIQEPEEDLELEDAVKKIQAAYRGIKVRKSIQISASAATKIQATFRGYKTRKELKRYDSLGDIRNTANTGSSSNVNINIEDQCAAKIQASVRGYLVRKRHSLQNNAAAKIQINYRKYKYRKETKDSPKKSPIYEDTDNRRVASEEYMQAMDTFVVSTKPSDSTVLAGSSQPVVSKSPDNSTML